MNGALVHIARVKGHPTLSLHISVNWFRKCTVKQDPSLNPRDKVVLIIKIELVIFFAKHDIEMMMTFDF